MEQSIIEFKKRKESQRDASQQDKFFKEEREYSGMLNRDNKQLIDELESQIAKLKGDNKRLEIQLRNLQVRSTVIYE